MDSLYGPEHLLHPFVVHVPLVLPFVCILLLWVKREDLSTVAFELRFLAGADLLFSVAAYYTGLWRADILPQPFPTGIENAYGWHYLYGRASLILSVVFFICVVIATFAEKQKRVFFLLAYFSACLLAVAVILSGDSGAKLVHIHRIDGLIKIPR